MHEVLDTLGVAADLASAGDVDRARKLLRTIRAGRITVDTADPWELRFVCLVRSAIAGYRDIIVPLTAGPATMGVINLRGDAADVENTEYEEYEIYSVHGTLIMSGNLVPRPIACVGDILRINVDVTLGTPGQTSWWEVF